MPRKELNGTGRLVWVSKVMVVIGMKKRLLMRVKGKTLTPKYLEVNKKVGKKLRRNAKRRFEMRLQMETVGIIGHFSHM